MLAQDEIRRLRLVRLESGEEPPLKNFDVTSYNLCLGKQYFLFAGRDSTPPVQDCSSGTGILRIPPFASVLVGTEELVHLPDGVYARWGLKIRPAMSGLIFQAGPQIEPGSNGRMFGLLFNLSSSERVLHHATPLWSVDFATLDGRPSDQMSPLVAHAPVLDLSAYTTQGVPGGSLNSIYADYVDLNKENSRKREFSLGIFLSLTMVLASIILPLVVTFLAGREGQMARLEQRVAQLETPAPSSSTMAPTPSPTSTP